MTAARQIGSTQSCDTTQGTVLQRYVYGGLGRRMKIDGSSSTTWTVPIFSGMDAIYRKFHVDGQSDQITKYVYANGMRIAKINPDGTVHYFLSDHQGSTRKILDSTTAEQYSVEYEPFGKPHSTSGPKPDPYKFTMEKHDDPTGLVYLRARQYDPEIGRFVSADPVLGSLSTPQTQNRYAYVINNPLRFTDATGEFLNIVIGAIAGGLIGYGLCVWATGGWTSAECGKAALIGAAVGAFAGATFGLGMAAFGVGTAAQVAAGSATIVAGSWAAVGAGVGTGMAVGAQSYFLASILGIGLGTMSSEDMSMEDFAASVALGGLFGGLGGKAYNPETYWSGRPTYHNSPEGRPISPHARWRMFQRGVSGQNVDEVVNAGSIFRDPLHGSNMYVKPTAQMQTPISAKFGGRYMQIAIDPDTGVIKTVIGSRNVPSRFKSP